VTFDSERALFRAQVKGLAEAIEIIPRGLTKEALMGEASTIAALPAYQLALLNARGAARDGLYPVGAAHDFMRLCLLRAGT
jgi:hypothetical protein